MCISKPRRTHKIGLRMEFGRAPRLLEEAVRNPLYVARDKVYRDRYQHVIIERIDMASIKAHGPYAFVIVTEKLQPELFDVVTAFMSRTLPRVDVSEGGFLYVRQ